VQRKGWKKKGTSCKVGSGENPSDTGGAEMSEVSGVFGDSQGVGGFDAVSEGEVQFGDVRGFATFSVLSDVGGKKKQRTYKVTDFHEVIADYSGREDVDVYVTQHQYFRWNRRKASVKRLSSCYVDLDSYRVERLQGRSAESLAAEVVWFCEEGGIPEPSAILSSGKGMYLKWYLEGVRSGKMGEWDRLQRELVQVFGGFGADPAARDASRVLRVLGTTNQKNGQKVRPVWLNEEGGKVKQYRFQELFDDVLPYTLEEVVGYGKGEEKWREREERAFQAKEWRIEDRDLGLHLDKRQLSFCSRGLHMFSDLQKLSMLRGWEKTGIPDGQRDLYLFWLVNHGFLGFLGSYHPDVYQEVAYTLKALVPTWRMDRVHNALSAVYKRAKEAHQGQPWVSFEGRLYPKLYTPSNARLVEDLRITDQELEQMDYLRFGGSEAAQRKRKRREEGKLSQEERSLSAQQRREEALRLREEGKTWRQVGEALGVSNRRAIKIAAG
jgi:hypothetical protein